jgi:hypothetical protein
MSNPQTFTAIHRRSVPRAIALAVALVCATAGAATAQSPPDKLAYCDQLYAMYLKYHFNLYHMDSWAPPALAHIDCVKGNFDDGIKGLEHVLRNDRFVLNGPPTTVSTAQR